MPARPFVRAWSSLESFNVKVLGRELWTTALQRLRPLDLALRTAAWWPTADIYAIASGERPGCSKLLSVAVGRPTYRDGKPRAFARLFGRTLSSRSVRLDALVVDEVERTSPKDFELAIVHVLQRLGVERVVVVGARVVVE